MPATLRLAEWENRLEIVVVDLPADRQLDQELGAIDGTEWGRDHIKVEEDAVEDVVGCIESQGYEVENELRDDESDARADGGEQAVRCDGGEPEGNEDVAEFLDDVYGSDEPDVALPDLEACAESLKEVPAVDRVQRRIPDVGGTHLLVDVDPEGQADSRDMDDPLSEVQWLVESYHGLDVSDLRSEDGAVRFRVTRPDLRAQKGYAMAAVELAELAAEASPAEALDWWMVKRGGAGLPFGGSQSAWKEQRDVSRQIVSEHVNAVERDVDLADLPVVGHGGDPTAVAMAKWLDASE